LSILLLLLVRCPLSPFQVLGVDLVPDDSLTLAEMLELGVAKHVERIAEVSLVANKQFTLEKGLDAMRAEWANTGFELVPYKNSGTYIVRGVDVVTQVRRC
jgi:dynein heavy chain, axonemal